MTNPKSYRPISHLPLVSNITEKSIHFQIKGDLNKKKLIYMYQSGFRTNYSTDFCLAELINFVLHGMDKQTHSAMILVDLQKGFHTLDHGILHEKMIHCGFRASVIKWFESCLSNRKCLLCNDMVFPDATTLNYGVPHDSFFYYM